MTTAIAKPFIKWAGGKRSLVQRILELAQADSFRPDTHRYIEPFVGGGAVFFALQSLHGNQIRSTISDANPYLMRAYRGLRDNPLHTVQALKRHAALHSKAYYMEMRSAGPPDSEYQEAESAAWFIYLNKTCFNGLWRVNKSGMNNVPMGSSKTPPVICDEEVLLAASAALQWTHCMSMDFEKTAEEAKPGDLVYMDPPYIPLNHTSFTAYTKTGFSYKDHVRLRDTAMDLKNRGVRVIISNSDTKATRDLYQDSSVKRRWHTDLTFTLHEVQARRSINCQSGGRGPVGELIIT